MNANLTIRGAILLLIEESAAMGARAADGEKSWSANVATAVNALLAQLDEAASLAVGLIGYGAHKSDKPDAAHRWEGNLQGRRWVTVDALKQSPLRVETRIRKSSGMAGAGQLPGESVQFPIWYDPKSVNASSMETAFELATRAFISDLAADGFCLEFAPLVLHLFITDPPAHSALAAVSGLQRLQFDGHGPLLFHFHLAKPSPVPSKPTSVPLIAYPSNRAYLPRGAAAELFDASIRLPQTYAKALREAKVNVNKDARGMVYNGRTVDLIRFLSLGKTYAQTLHGNDRDTVNTVGSPAKTLAEPTVSPVITPDSTSTLPENALNEGVSIHSVGKSLVDNADNPLPVLLVFDRSTETSAPSGTKSVWERLQDRGNILLGQLAAQRDIPIVVSVLSYGAGGGDGALLGNRFIPSVQLEAAAIRIETVEEQVSNGMGGLLTVSKRKPVFLEIGSTESASPVPAFRNATRLLKEWYETHPSSRRPPIVLHFTRGKLNGSDVDQSVALLADGVGANESPLLYHMILTESPAKSLAYPGAAAQFDDPSLLKLWEVSSPLLERGVLMEKRPYITDTSRGFVVNGKFEFLLPSA